MAYPYKKMTSQDCDYIRSVTAPDRVWVGEEIASEYYRDEMPEYGVYQPDLYVEVVNKEEVSAIMAYAYKENIPVVCRGAGTGLAGGAPSFRRRTSSSWTCRRSRSRRSPHR